MISSINCFISKIKVISCAFLSENSFVNALPFIRVRKIIFFSLTLLVCAGAGSARAQQDAATAPRFRLAVFPIDNLSDTSVPAREIRQSLTRNVLRNGIQIVDDDSLEKVMARNRIRYTGGLDAQTAKALKDEAGIDAVLITSLELYQPGDPPKIALTARLVATDPLEVKWMESIGLAGDDAPGILGLGLIADPQQLQEKALRQLATSLAVYFDKSRNKRQAGGVAKTFQPKLYYASEGLDRARKSTIAVIPFLNQGRRYRAGEIALLHFLKQLVGIETVRVVEPGLVREKMLNNRIIMNEGVSYRDEDVIGIPLNVDYFLTGQLFEYQDYPGASVNPRVDFSAMLIETMKRKVVWASNSYNAGDDAVFFFDAGRVSTAGVLADKMTRAIAARMFGVR